jgi:hypothetical protein
MKKIISCILSIAIVLSVMMISSTSFAEDYDVNKTLNVTLYTNDGCSLDIPESLADAKWVVTNKKLVKVTKDGKDSTGLSLKTNNRTGKCTIKASVQGETIYKIKLTVKKGRIFKKYNGKKVKAVLDSFSSKTWVVSVKLCNGSDKNQSYGSPFKLQKYTDGKWKTVPMKEPLAFDASMRTLPAHKSMIKKYYLSEVYDTSKLTAGKYRLYVNYLGEKNSNSYVKFIVK